ncbi:hypothetical protein RYH80_08550 [Halobaculum sp. MBLA0147]
MERVSGDAATETRTDDHTETRGRVVREPSADGDTTGDVRAWVESLFVR